MAIIDHAKRRRLFNRSIELQGSINDQLDEWLAVTQSQTRASALFATASEMFEELQSVERELSQIGIVAPSLLSATATSALAALERHGALDEKPRTGDAMSN